MTAVGVVCEWNGAAVAMNPSGQISINPSEIPKFNPSAEGARLRHGLGAPGEELSASGQ